MWKKQDKHWFINSHWQTFNKQIHALSCYVNFLLTSSTQKLEPFNTGPSNVADLENYELMSSVRYVKIKFLLSVYEKHLFLFHHPKKPSIVLPYLTP